MEIIGDLVFKAQRFAGWQWDNYMKVNQLSKITNRIFWKPNVAKWVNNLGLVENPMRWPVGVHKFHATKNIDPWMCFRVKLLTGRDALGPQLADGF